MNRAPSLDEIEVSVFGPGYGECILIHVGDNKWFIIDSCIEPKSKELPVLNYLEQIGVEPSDAVKMIIATHWHDDHVRGISTLVESCRSAQFCLSSALRAKEFLTLIAAYGKRTMMVNSGVKEFSKVIDVLQTRRNNPKEKAIPLKYAIADRCLWSTKPNELEKGQACKIYSLSPSDAAILLTHKAFANLLPQIGQPKNRLFVNSPNHVAVVLWIEVGDLFILLGSDLEETSDPQTGWSVIVGSTTSVQGKASLFKIPHHGSKNGDHPDVWSLMLEAQPVAVLTPFSRGQVHLPTFQDISRICTHTENAYMTAFKRSKIKKRDKMVEKMIQQTVKSIKPIPYSTGQIRCRIKPDNGTNTWQVELFGEAHKLYL